jgi:hypothetical protein
MKRAIFTVILLMGLTVGAAAEEHPIQLSLFNPIQIFPETDAITGVRLNIYGKNTTLTGLDLGFIHHLTTGHSKGVQFGLVGWVEADMSGWQNCMVNINKGTFTGLQWGTVNYTGHAKGMMLGFVNYAESMHGLQIGLVNIIREGAGFFPVLPIINWSF